MRRLNIFRKIISVIKDNRFSRIFVGCLEPIIEDSIFFGGKVVDPISIAWLGGIEFWGVGQSLLLFTSYSNGERVFVTFVLWMLSFPIILLTWGFGLSIIRSLVHHIWIWSTPTILYMAFSTLFSSLEKLGYKINPIKTLEEKTRLNLAYLILGAGFTLDVIASFLNGFYIDFNFEMKIPLAIYLSLVMMVTMHTVAFLLNKFEEKIRIDDKVRGEAGILTFVYLIILILYIYNVVPGYFPLTVVVVGILSIILYNWFRGDDK